MFYIFCENLFENVDQKDLSYRNCSRVSLLPDTEYRIQLGTGQELFSAENADVTKHCRVSEVSKYATGGLGFAEGCQRHILEILFFYFLHLV